MTPKGRLAAKGFTWVALAASLFVFPPPTVSAQPSHSDEALQDFFQAVIRDDPQAAREILLANTNLARVPSRQYVNKLPLLVAASEGQLEIVDLLLKLGADVNAEGDTWNTANYRLTALEVSIWHNHPAVCQRLLEAKPDLNHQVAFHGSALQMACAQGRTEMAGWLLDRGADPFLAGPYPAVPTTSLTLNIMRGDGKLVPRMVKEHPTAAATLLRAEGVELLRTAATRGQVEAVAALLPAGASTQSPDETDRPLMQAVALVSSTANPLSDTPPARFAEVRDLLQKGGVAYDVFAATGFGDLETARRLWTTNRNLAQARDQFGATPLHWAVETDRLPLTSFWLESGAATAATNHAGQTPAHLAAARGFKDQLALLLAAHAPLDVRDTNGWTPLDAAMQAKQTETIRLLLSDQRSPAAPGRGVATSLHEAAASGNIAVLAGLVNATNIDARTELGLTPFQVAMQRGQLGAAAFLLDHGADVNARDPEGNTALHQIAGNWAFSIKGRPSANWIARRNQDPRQAEYLRFLTVGGDDGWPRYALQSVGFLLACGANATLTNQAGQTPVQLLLDSKTTAFEKERVELLKLLSGAGDNLDRRDARGDTALHRAARDFDGDPVAELLAAGANVNATNKIGRTPLHASLEKLDSWGSTPFEQIIAAKPNVNAQDEEGLTPLHLVALSEGSFRGEATKALLAAGANPNLRDQHGRMPVHVFLSEDWPWSGAEECVPLLVQAGADVTQPDRQGRTPLHLFAALGSSHQDPLFFARDLTNAFAADQVDFNAQDRQGDTPLHLAARRGDGNMFAWLCSRGAKLDVTNKAGATPRMLALSQTDQFARFRFPANEDIHEAAARDDAETIRRLLRIESKLAAATNQSGETPLRIAARNHQTNAVNALISSGAKWDEVSAAMLGRTDALQPILDRNRKTANVMAYGKPLLHWAAESGSVPSIELLLRSGAKLDARSQAGLSTLGAALRSNRTEVVTALRARGATENLFDCVVLDQPDQAVALFELNPAASNFTNPLGLTPLATAVALGRDRVLAALLEHRCPADPPASATNRLSALHVAAACNRTNEATLLLAHRANVEVTDNAGARPIHHAAGAGAAEVLEILLRHGAKPDVPVLSPSGLRGRPMLTAGTTALHLAALGGHTNAIAVLLQAGANVNPTNDMGLTPLDLARYGSQPGPMMMGLGYSWFAVPGAGLRLSLQQIGVTGLKRPSRVLIQQPAQVVITELERAGAKHGKPVRGRMN